MRKEVEKYKQTDIERLHNRFTSYLMRSSQRTRARYIQDQCKHAQEIFFSELPDYMDIEFLTPVHHFDEPPLVWANILDNMDNMDLYILLQKLSAEESRILFLHIILDMCYKDIAAKLDLTPAEVEMQYYSLIRRLRNTFQKGDENGLSSTIDRGKKGQP